MPIYAQYRSNFFAGRMISAVPDIARKLSNSFLLSITLIAFNMIVPNVVTAAPTPTQVMQTCFAANSQGDSVFSDLANDGWHAVDKFDHETLAVFSDGILASLVASRDETLNWATGFDRAAKIAADMNTGAIQNRPVRLFASRQSHTSALVVLDRSDTNYNVVQCLYAGPIDPELSGILDQIRDLDKNTGRNQATPGLQIHMIDETKPLSKYPDIIASNSAKIGWFRSSPLPRLNRAPHADIGMSLIRFYQK